MKPPDWEKIGRGRSDSRSYVIEGLKGPQGIAARIIFEGYPAIDVRGLFPDWASAREEAMRCAAAVFRK